MCSYIVEKAEVSGSAKGPSGWMRIDTANVYFDHPYHAPLDHALAIDFVCEADGGKERVAVELSAESARALVANILAALASGKGVQVVPVDIELTTQQAADVLNVSRPYLIGLLEDGKIPYRRVGRHRRIRFEDLMGYKRTDDLRRHAAAGELTQLGQELGLD